MSAQVSTKDGALVCRPDITLDGNTNIAQDKSLRGRESVQVWSRSLTSMLLSPLQHELRDCRTCSPSHPRDQSISMHAVPNPV